METVLRWSKGFGCVALALSLVAGAIFPFTEQEGLKGYLVVLLAVTAVWTALGATWVHVNRTNRGGLDPQWSSHLPHDAWTELEKDRHRSTELGMEVFFSGLAILVGAYYLYTRL